MTSDITYHVLGSLGFDRRPGVALLTAPKDDAPDFLQSTVRNAAYNWEPFQDLESIAQWMSG